MSLPVLNKVPKYKIKLPVSGKELTYRPFLVGEEKILLLAIQTGETVDDYLNAFAQVIDNCVEGGLDIENLPCGDIDYLFLQCRAKSIDEEIKVHKPCDNCTKQVPIKIEIDKLGIGEYDEESRNIKLTDTVSLVLRCPTLKDVRNHQNEEDKITFSFELLIDCMDYIVNGEEIIDVSTYSREELENWLNQLSKKDFQNIIKYFNTLPRVIYDDEVECPHCKEKNSVHVEGTRDFFTLLSRTQT